MGVSGCGKSTVAAALARAHGIAFVDGDDLHPAANLTKMTRGEPLTDDDRAPWLYRIGRVLSGRDGTRKDGTALGCVVACSALRRRYRDGLRSIVGKDLRFVFLDGSRDVIAARLAARRNHFMPAILLDSQFKTLERPDGETDVITAPADWPVPRIVNTVLRALHTDAAAPNRNV